MNFPIDKKRLVNILFAIAIILLAANLIASKLLNKEYVPSVNEITVDEINQKFLSAVYDFGIEKQWVHIKKVHDSTSDSLINMYSIEVPKDLPVAEILQEIFSAFYSENVQMVCHEKSMGGSNDITIYSNERAKLKALFEYSNDIKRNAGDIALIITGLDNLNENEVSKIIMAPENFTAAIVPSKKDTQLADSLYSNRKQYVILLNDDISDMDFKLQSNFPDDRLGNAIRSIIVNYSRALFFVVDDNSKLYKSKAFIFIKNELQKRNIRIVLESSFAHIEGNAEKFLRQFAHQIDGGKQILLELRAEDYLTVKPEIYALIKVGYKFVSPVKIELQQ